VRLPSNAVAGVCASRALTSSAVCSGAVGGSSTCTVTVTVRTPTPPSCNMRTRRVPLRGDTAAGNEFSGSDRGTRRVVAASVSCDTNTWLPGIPSRKLKAARISVIAAALARRATVSPGPARTKVYCNTPLPGSAGTCDAAGTLDDQS